MLPANHWLSHPATHTNSLAGTAAQRAVILTTLCSGCTLRFAVGLCIFIREAYSVICCWLALLSTFPVHVHVACRAYGRFIDDQSPGV